MKFDREKLYSSREQGLWLILLIYVMAFAVAICTFKLTSEDTHLLWRLFWADFAATVFVWLMSYAFDNASIYDPYWSVVPPILLTAMAIYMEEKQLQTIVLLVAVWLWAIRLTVNWALTFKNLKVQDWRYDKYKRQFPKIWQLVNFGGIHLMPTIIVFSVLVPGLFMMDMASQRTEWLTCLGFAMCLGAVTLQFFADRQMHRCWRETPGQVCDRGLWKYSRHPNYLGEILMWWGVYVMFLAACGWFDPTWKLLIGIGPLANTLLFVFISIPLMEKRQLANKPGYREYKERTSRLIPFIW